MLQFDTQALLPWTEDGGEYTSVRTAGDVTVPLDGVARYSLGTKEAARSNGVYLATDEKVTFALAAAELAAAGITPKPRDRFNPAGCSERVVLSVTRNPFLKFWDLVVRDLVVAYDLRDLLTVRRSAPTAAADGLRVRNPADANPNVPGRLQPDEWQREIVTDRRVTTRRKYTAYLGQPLELQAGDTLVLAGVEYEVTGQSDISSFDTLTRVACERIS